jgi:hypothetical protein
MRALAKENRIYTPQIQIGAPRVLFDSDDLDVASPTADGQFRSLGSL